MIKTKTEKHDKIHLWFHNPENQKLFVDTIMRDISAKDLKPRWGVKYNYDHKTTPTIHINSYVPNYLDFNPTKILSYNIESKKIELPIVKGRTVSHTNTIDCLITLDCLCDAYYHNEHSGWEYTDYHYNTDDVIDYIYDDKPKVRAWFGIKILCEFKPVLDSISSILGQMHIYQKWLHSTLYRDDYNIIPVLVTLDHDSEYDSLIENDGIRIFRLEYNAANTTVTAPSKE